jgi:NAD(P)-dependent dehydrogenase (short-subunit alcohol dehydrogenase family)
MARGVPPVQPPGPQSGRLHGRVGLITGAASGIGAAGAALFAAQGAALILLDLDADRGQQVADGVRAQGGRAEFMPGDASSAADVSRAVQLAVTTFGQLDLLWANAGIGVAKTVPEMTLDEWDRVLAVNLTGAFLLAKFGIPELAAAGGPAASRSTRSVRPTRPRIRCTGSPTPRRWPRPRCSCPAPSRASPPARRCWWTGA